jgi:hypothetical protein
MSADFDPVIAAAGSARFVLIGEASHGTHEFYCIRAEITKRLIRECAFDAVAVEADWPDAYRVNRYVRGAGPDRDAVDALDDSSARRTRTGFSPAGSITRGRSTISVKRIRPSRRSTVPSASTASEVSSIFEACAMARKVRRKHASTAASRSSSGLQAMRSRTGPAPALRARATRRRPDRRRR